MMSHRLIANLFLFLNSSPLYGYGKFIDSADEGYLDCLQILVIMNKAAFTCRF